ncbi:SprT family zinc-dependent metalloprotease [Vibrio gallicus]|uniref:SprT family zinc-dependent metalloprotease n=1 Tax=Vibrio gallicus TaxID=190897 RepID=UPI0021C4B62D|nr:SprT family zinc-dependent metalloprotease [Vibrio gallicus]
MNSFQQQIDTKLKSLINTANQHFERTFSTPQLQFNLRGKAAGQALLQLNIIKLNMVLAQENPTAFIDEVLAHELAHLITFQVFGRVRPHGKEWQYTMERVFNIPAKRTHSMDVKSVQGKTFEYHCGCNYYPLSIRRHNKVVRNHSAYTCKLCGNKLLFTGKQLS